MLKVLKAALIYSNNLGYIQKYHYRCVRALTHTHTLASTHAHTLYRVCNFRSASWAEALWQSAAQSCKKYSFPFNGIPKVHMPTRECVCVAFCARVALCACFPFLPAHPFRSHLRVSGWEVKWEMWILRSHQFAKQQGRID